MPKTNPKHQRKRVAIERKQSLMDSSFPTRYLIMALIFIAAVTTIIILVVTLNPKDNNKTEKLIVQDGDIVVLEYKIWRNPNLDTNAELEERVADRVQNNYERNVSKDNITPLGLYNHILGKQKGYGGYFTLKAYVDADKNGLDDTTGEIVLGYGDPTSEFYNTQVTFYVKILNITKSAANAPKTSGIGPAESTLNSLNELESFNNLFLLNDLF
jgi:hypothetical protein